MRIQIQLDTFLRHSATSRQIYGGAATPKQTYWRLFQNPDGKAQRKGIFDKSLAIKRGSLNILLQNPKQKYLRKNQKPWLPTQKLTHSCSLSNENCCQT